MLQKNNEIRMFHSLYSFFATIIVCVMTASSSFAYEKSGDLYDPNTMPEGWQKTMDYLTPESSGMLYVETTVGEFYSLRPKFLHLLKSVTVNGKSLLKLERSIDPNSARDQILMTDSSGDRAVGYIKGDENPSSNYKKLWMKVLTKASLINPVNDEFSYYFPINLHQSDDGSFTLSVFSNGSNIYFDSMILTKRENALGIMIGIKSIQFMNSHTKRSILTLNF